VVPAATAHLALPAVAPAARVPLAAGAPARPAVAARVAGGAES
jgi:hypothetical protein